VGQTFKHLDDVNSLEVCAAELYIPKPSIRSSFDYPDNNRRLYELEVSHWAFYSTDFVLPSPLYRKGRDGLMETT